MADVDVSALCRLCAQNSDCEESIFFYDEEIDLVTAVDRCLSIHITANDGLPTIMCKKCRTKIISFNKFYNMCNQAQLILTNLIKQNSNEEAKSNYTLQEVKIELSDHIKSEDPSEDDNDDYDDYIPISQYLLKEHEHKNKVSPTKSSSKHHNSRRNDERSSDNYNGDNGDENNDERADDSEMLLEDVSSATSKKNRDRIVENSFIKFFCKECKINFKNWPRFKSHTKEKHRKKAKVLCICDKYLQTYNSIIRHVMKHSITTHLKCPDCEKTFPNQRALKVHSITHLPKDQYPHPCNECEKKFATKLTLKMHQKTHIPKELRYIHPCDICGVMFTSKGSVKTHISTVHEKLRPFVCDVCGHAFGNKGNLSEHRALHSDEKLHRCPKCPKMFKTKGTLLRHIDSHDDTSYKCPECPALLNSRRTLRMHMCVHENIFRYICAFCNKGYKRRKSLKSHMNIHTGERPFSCPWCSRTFADNSNCRIHKKRMHPNELALYEAANAPPEEMTKTESKETAKIIYTTKFKFSSANKTTKIILPQMDIKPDMEMNLK